MKFKELKDKKKDEINKLLLAVREDIRKARFGNSGSKTKNVKEIKNHKKTVARILTVINKK